MRGQISKKGDGRYLVRVYLGSDPVTGKRRYKGTVVKGTKKEAEAHLARLIRDVEDGSYVEPTRLTVAEWIRRWLELAKPQIAIRTWERYRSLAEDQIIPHLGAVRLNKLTPLQIQEFEGRMLESGRKDGKGGLAPQTVLHIHRVLRRALQVAVKMQVLIRNSVTAVDPPKVSRHEMQALNEDQAFQLLEAAKGTRIYPIIHLALHTGLRRSEILGLQWGDIDLEEGTLQVLRSLQQTQSGDLQLGDTKTHRSRRGLPMAAEAIDVLRGWRRQQLQDRLKLGAAYQESPYVFTEEEGGPIKPNRLTWRFKLLIQRVGIPGLRFHDLRHSTASLLIRAGESMKVIQDVMGHSTISTTGDIYGHLFLDTRRNAADKLGRLIAEGKDSKRKRRQG